MSRRLSGVALLLMAVGLVAGCSTQPTEGPRTGGRPNLLGAVPQAGSAPVSVGPEAGSAVAVPQALTFTGTTLDGAAFDASTLAGKPVVLWFWAPWCATCASEAQSVADLAEQYRDRLGIVGVAGMGNNKDMHEFVSDMSVGAVPHLDDQAGKIWKRFKITEQSTYVVVDRAGTVLSTGYLDDQQLTAEVKQLLA